MSRNPQKAYLLLEDGTLFEGLSMGKRGTAVGEVVFNTCTASYTSLLSDPTYYGQIVAQTYPLVGNRGVAAQNRSSDIMANGYIVREWCDVTAEGELTLDEYLRTRGIVGLCGIDMRRLTRALRDKGYVKGAITDSLDDKDTLLEHIRAYTISGAVEAITIREPQEIKAESEKYRVCVMDYGFPREILEGFIERDCSLELLPASYTAERVRALSPDGIFLSDGPADPDDNPAFVREIAEMTKLGVPIFAVGLGHQMLALAAGAQIEKMHQGHRGSNQPVLCAHTNRLMVTEQNHGYAVRRESVSTDCAEVFLTNVNDGSVEGLFYRAFPGFSVQFTPSADPASSTSWVFDRFMQMMGEARK